MSADMYFTCGSCFASPEQHWRLRMFMLHYSLPHLLLQSVWGHQTACPSLNTKTGYVAYLCVAEELDFQLHPVCLGSDFGDEAVLALFKELSGAHND